MAEQNIILEGIHYTSGKAIRLGIRSGRIFSLTLTEKRFKSDDADTEPFPVIAPGLVDLQLNGYMGIDFNDEKLAPEQIESVSLKLLRQGVTRFYPTLITGSLEKISTLLKTFTEVINQKIVASQMIGGIHLEGPFISREDGPRGAHPERFCMNPDVALVRRWQEEAGGWIRIITIAPELRGTLTLIRACRDMGIIVAIGHTAASTDQIRKAVDAGATLSTHLGNGSHNMLPRHPNYIWDQLAEERLYASMIADGFHLPDSVLKVFMRAKKEKAILVSDGMPYTGLEPGIYESPATGKIRLTSEGKLHMEGNPEVLSGSASTLLDGINKITSLEGFHTAWDMGSVNPARLMDPAAQYGLHVGAPADLVLLEPNRTVPIISEVYKNGEHFPFTIA